jgi:hypothetical protein
VCLGADSVCELLGLLLAFAARSLSAALTFVFPWCVVALCSVCCTVQSSSCIACQHFPPFVAYICWHGLQLQIPAMAWGPGGASHEFTHRQS